MSWSCWLWQGKVRHGQVRYGRLGWQGKVRYGQVRLVKAWQVWMGLFRHGTLWLGKAGEVRHVRSVRVEVGYVRFRLVWLGWAGKVCHGMSRYGKFWKGQVRQAGLG